MWYVQASIETARTDGEQAKTRHEVELAKARAGTRSLEDGLAAVESVLEEFSKDVRTCHMSTGTITPPIASLTLFSQVEDRRLRARLGDRSVALSERVGSMLVHLEERTSSKDIQQYQAMLQSCKVIHIT